MGNEPKWTPGPWHVGWDSRAPGDYDPEDSDCDVVGPNSSLIVDASFVYGDDVETSANLHLIAAAPDLYAALLEARNWMRIHFEPTASDHERYNAALEQVGAALAKARGETPDGK